LGRELQKKFDFSQIASIDTQISENSYPLFHDANAIHIKVNNGIVNKQHLALLSGKGLKVMSLNQAARQFPDELGKHIGMYAQASKDPFTALNTAFSYEGIFIKVEKNTIIEKPILIHYTYGSNAISKAFQSRNLMLIEQGAKVRSY
jgi:Fe-S cluster assembly scaffold protein SufB